MTIMSVIWLLPILWLSGSILYCSIRLWLMYKEEIHIQVHRTLEKIGLWKMGMGRWVRLGRYIFYYVISAAASVPIFIAISAVTGVKAVEQIATFVERLGTAEFGKLLTTVGFAMVTVIESLLMYGRDFSKVTNEMSKLQKFFLEYFWGKILPVLLWGFAGFTAYKDIFFRATHEWLSSPGRVFRLCLGVVSVGIFGFALINNIYEWNKGSADNSF